MKKQTKWVKKDDVMQLLKIFNWTMPREELLQKMDEALDGYSVSVETEEY